MSTDFHNDSTYTNHGCRCDQCRASHTESVRRRRQERYQIVRTRGLPESVSHGSFSTYCNWGCRCADCCAANTRERHKQKSRKKAQSA